MAEEEKRPDLPATGGSYTRDAKTGKLTRAEEPTVQEPGSENSVPAAAEAAETPPASGKKAKET